MLDRQGLLLLLLIKLRHYSRLLDHHHRQPHYRLPQSRRLRCLASRQPSVLRLRLAMERL